MPNDINAQNRCKSAKFADFVGAKNANRIPLDASVKILTQRAIPGSAMDNGADHLAAADRLLKLLVVHKVIITILVLIWAAHSRGCRNQACKMRPLPQNLVQNGRFPCGTSSAQCV